MKKDFEMYQLVKELNRRGIPATYEMTGGNNGTIYAGRIDRRGFYECVIGTSDFSTGLAEYGDLCYGKDGDDRPISQSLSFVTYGTTPEELADEIEREFFTYCCGACGLQYRANEADYAGFHQVNLCEGAN